MKRIPEFAIMQNTALGALAIHSFVREYYSAKDKKDGVFLPYLLPLLPIVFNEKASLRISSKQRRVTSFNKAISEEIFIPIGLQNRMMDMYTLSMDSINSSLALGLIECNNKEALFYPKEKIRLPDLKTSDNINILRASSILGFWFASISLEDLCISLNITF